MMEERHNLVMDLRNREAMVEKLKSRYESISHNYNIAGDLRAHVIDWPHDC